MLDKGIIIAGDIKVNLLDIELLTIKIRLLVVSVDKAMEMGIDWWRNDPMLTTREQDLAEENRELKQRLEAGVGWVRGHGERELMSERVGTSTRSVVASRGSDLALRRGRRRCPLEVVRHRGLDAVVSSMSTWTEFGEEGLQRNLEDLEWLETVARRHDDVVQLVAGTGSVAPLRLATICLDDDGVRARLDEWYQPSSRCWTGCKGAWSGASRSSARLGTPTTMP